ncbi:aspartyl-phosphate phosphatase Spo0E family protein [Paenibacillus sp. YYML68]|uniref:aspartyl-phosphate phosphatase Spo0E family protein n=1 Tax=Paenibacillus sp. YYML68 TaxID=2909250 RepID=UPI0024914518|nr:aspartyl-phosphate phosphatase Spo0E family protein [Paenibacillus sp. YYML68]
MDNILTPEAGGVALLRDIELLREKMVQMGLELGLMHPAVQLTSQQLDELLLRYYELSRTDKLARAAVALEESAVKEYTLV